MTATKQTRDPCGLYLAGSADEDPARLVAEAALRPQVQAALTVREYAYAPFGEVELMSLVDTLSDQAKSTENGDLRRGEATLTAQAHTLDAIFNTLARRAAKAERMAQLESYLRLALRAQAQSRAAWEAIAAIRNPPMLSFVGQANIAHGPQQVNNLSAPPREAASAREDQNLKNKLLETFDGNKLDFGTTGAAGGADPSMATLGTLDRAEDRGREGCGFPERLQGRHLAAAP